MRCRGDQADSCLLWTVAPGPIAIIGGQLGDTLGGANFASAQLSREPILYSRWLTTRRHRSSSGRVPTSCVCVVAGRDGFRHCSWVRAGCCGRHHNWLIRSTHGNDHEDLGLGTHVARPNGASSQARLVWRQGCGTHGWGFQVFALLLLPWIVAATTTEGMADSMAEAKGSTFAALIGFGSVWGLGQVTFGISQDLVGVSLTYALVMGTLATMGTLLPMLVYTPEDFATVSGAFTLAGLVVIVIGLVLVSKAGRLKELALQQRAGDQDAGVGTAPAV